MLITPMKYNSHKLLNDSLKEPSFGHGGEAFWNSDYSTRDKLIVAGTTAAGVLGSLAVFSLAKGNSLKPKSFWNYLKNTKIKAPEIITMGLGTCLGGLAGGYIIDKNKENRKAKHREAVMQIGNISIPILIVDLVDRICEKFKVSKETGKGKAIRIISSLAAIISGIYLANYIMNKISNIIFKDNSNARGVKGTDLFPHVDDVLGAAQYLDEKSKVTHKISRIIPFALLVPGNEIGNKKAER